MTVDITPPRLAVLADEIRVEVAAAEADWQSAVQHAITAGARLIEAKGIVNHGEWLPWVEANFPGSEATAQRYMQLARNPERVRDLPSIRGAIALLALPKLDADRQVESAEQGRNVGVATPLGVTEDRITPRAEYDETKADADTHVSVERSEWHRNMRQIDSNRILTSLAEEVQAWPSGLDLMDPAALDPDVIAECLPVIRRGMRAISSHLRRIGVPEGSATHAQVVDLQQRKDER